MHASLISALRWLRPGLGLKRWIISLLSGLVILGLGIGLFLRELYTDTGYPVFLRQEWSDWLKVALLSLAGVGLVGFSIFQLNKMVLAAFLPERATVGYVAEQIYRHRRRGQYGIKVVVIGGGTGLSVLLRGLKHYTDHITAIVTVADDGGSSGKLRRELGVLPPGDFRNCIAALADDEALLTQLFQYRFRGGQGLEGHSFGNLFITAMAEVTGKFETALYESGRVLNIHGTILPSTLEHVMLSAELKMGSQTRRVDGESAIPEARLPIERVYLQPDAPPLFPPALQAILNADLIVAGPGSLYTSIIPNLLVAEIVTVIHASQVPKIYICNVATQPGETDNYSLDDHVQAIEAHTYVVDNRFTETNEDDWTGEVKSPQKSHLFDFVLANNNLAYPIPAGMNLKPVLPVHPADKSYRVIEADIVDQEHPWRHDPVKLAYHLIKWYKSISY